MTTKTMSIRMDRGNYEFLSAMTMEEQSDLSKAVRDLVTRGRILLAVEKYRKGEASLGKAAEVAGLPVGQMMTLLGEFGVRSRVDREDYRQSLAHLGQGTGGHRAGLFHPGMPHLAQPGSLWRHRRQHAHGIQQLSVLEGSMLVAKILHKSPHCFRRSV